MEIVSNTELDREEKYRQRLIRVMANLGFYRLEKDRPVTPRFQVNPELACTHVHHRGRCFKKGVIYDAGTERLSRARLERMLELKIKGTRFFVLYVEERPEPEEGKDNGR